MGVVANFRTETSCALPNNRFLTSSPDLSRGIPVQHLTAQVEYDMGRVDVSIMRGTILRTRPYSYAQRPQSTRAGSVEAARASNAGPGFVDFAVGRSKPHGFVVQERAKLTPPGVIHGSRHGGSG